MRLYTIPYQDQYIIYRPLLRLAFVGNGAMAQLCARKRDDIHHAEAYPFLEQIGFFQDDPPFPDNATEIKTYAPTVCVLFLTNQCNLRCIYCYADGGEKPPETMTFPLAQAAIDRVCGNAMDQGLRHYVLAFHGGGEPTLAWPLLKSCVEYARGKKLPATISLTSNGVWNQEQRHWLLENIDEISISFDGSPQVQDKQRPLKAGGASSGMVLKTIAELDRRNKPYGIRVTVTDDSLPGLTDMVSFLCQETDAYAIQVEPAFNHGRARRDRQTLRKNARFAKAFMAGYDIAQQYDRHIYYSGARPWLLANRFCDAFAKALIVGPDGFLSACFEVCGRNQELSKDFIFGSLDDEGAICLDPQIRASFLARLAERKQTCRDCFCYFHCAGDCPAKTFTNNPRGYLRHGSRCDLNRLITKELIIRFMLEGNGVWQGDRQEETSAGGI